ncbi:MAG TPA: hypothetical protein VMR43_07655 [Variovorax sp.]|nr:hypothetical protein [Variovorax sp.]
MNCVQSALAAWITAFSIAGIAQTPPTVATSTGDANWKEASAYGSDKAANVLRRSVFFMPLFGAVFPEKFEALLKALPPTSLRGVIVYNHGCSGQWGWETTVAAFLYRQGFAVVTPDFPSREDNKSGCAGGTEAEMLRMAAQRSREGVYQAINPARLAARGQDITNVVAWLKTQTSLPILIGGHSEGCRATYALHLTDPQVVGGICVKQGLQTQYEHTWRWNTAVPLWQSLEENDPWVVPPGSTVRDVTFERKFKDHPENLTMVIVPGRTHDPLVQEAERASLMAWLNQHVPQQIKPGQNGFDYESVLPEIQRKLRP